MAKWTGLVSSTGVQHLHWLAALKGGQVPEMRLSEFRSSHFNPEIPG